jgi:RNA polymerase sigma-70 factor (ECF subfamily)
VSTSIPVPARQRGPRPAEPAAVPVEDAGELTALGGRSAAGGIAQSLVQALVKAAQAGDQDAFAQLYELYARKIQSYLRYHLNGRSDLAEDLAADVFLKAMEKIHSYQFSGVPFSAWLYRIAHNHLIDYLRSLPKKQGVSLDECSGVDDPSAERALDETLTQYQLSGALSGLTAEQRQVILYRFMEDRSIADTARLMAKNEDAIKQLQVRALRNMRRCLTVAV